MALKVKNLPANAGDVSDAGSIPELGRSPGEGNGNLLQYSCLENPMDSWRATSAIFGCLSSSQTVQYLHTDSEDPGTMGEEKGMEKQEFSSGLPFLLGALRAQPHSAEVPEFSGLRLLTSKEGLGPFG